MNDTRASRRMIICANCHSENREGEFFCAVCGCGLINDPRTPIYMRREGVEVKTDRLAWGTSHFEEGDQLVIYVRDDATPIIVEPGTQMVVGRSDAYSGVSPDLDLAAYRAVERGVSRYHAAIHRVEQALMLEDLNSSNGTRVNGRRVPPGQPWVLHDGDELRLGNLIMHLYFTAVPRLQRS